LFVDNDDHVEEISLFNETVRPSEEQSEEQSEQHSEEHSEEQLQEQPSPHSAPQVSEKKRKRSSRVAKVKENLKPRYV
jgi:hypothetical protein